MFSAILLSFAQGSGWDQLLFVTTELPARFVRPVPRFEPEHANVSLLCSPPTIYDIMFVMAKLPASFPWPASRFDFMSYLLWERRVDNYSPVNERTYPHYTPRCEIKDLRNINNLIHRPEEVLDIQSELIFVNGMVHLPQEWNFRTPTTLPSPATPSSSLTATHQAIFPLTYVCDITCSIYVLFP